MTQNVILKPFLMPFDLRRELPDPHTPWMMSEKLCKTLSKPAPTSLYQRARVLPEDKEWRFIWRYFHSDKPTRYGIKRIWIVHQEQEQKAFEMNLTVQERESEIYPPTWDKEPRAEQRAKIIERWKQATDPFSPFHYQGDDRRNLTCIHTKILPLWHGASEKVWDSISTSDFAYFEKRSIGDQTATSANAGFGNGMYFTNSPRYAADIYSRGHLLMAWVTMRHPFPVVGDPQQQDKHILANSGAYKNYNAHYIPVTPTQNNPLCAEYYPSQPSESPLCDEYVVFQKPQALARYWVELEVEIPYLMNISSDPQGAGELIPHLMRLLQNPPVDKDLKLRNFLNQQLAILFQLREDEDLTESQMEFYYRLVSLIANGTIDKDIRKQLLESFPFVGGVNAASNLGVSRDVAPLSSSSNASVALPPNAFGPDEWKKYFGNVEDPYRSGPHPLEEHLPAHLLQAWKKDFPTPPPHAPLPSNIEAILDSPCPFWSGKKVKETHLLVYKPKYLNGELIDLTSLGKAVEKPLQGNPTRYIRDPYHPTTDTEYWFLLTTDVIPGSRNKSYYEQQSLLDEYAKKGNVVYEIPHLIDTVICNFIEKVRFGKHLYGRDPATYTRCVEKAGRRLYEVGGFGLDGLDVTDGFDNNANERIGLAAQRKL